MDTNKHQTITADRAIINALGGPSKLAEMLGFDKYGGTQRVQNWRVRGIPPAIKLAYPDIFLPGAVTTVSRRRTKKGKNKA